MDDDRIIDLAAHRRASGRRPEGGLSLLGADGEARPFALPLWRMAVVSGADWAGLVRCAADGVPRVRTAVDLTGPDCRTEPDDGLQGLEAVAPPAVVQGAPGSVRLPLGEVAGSVWWVVLSGCPEGTPGPRQREELLFLAGECAGLASFLPEGD